MGKVVALQVDPDWLAERLHDWPDGNGPMYRRLAVALERLLAAGEVAGGARLPAERLLAAELRVSRTTVAAAYEMLENRRLVRRRHGSGTYANAVRSETPPPRESLLMRSLERNEIFDGLIDPPRALLDLRAAVIHDAPALPEHMLEGMAEDLVQASGRHGYVPAGLPALRAAIADRYTDSGLPTTAEQVLITGGAQQAIALVTTLHVRPDDVVVTEELTHTGAIDLFTSAGARVRTVPVGPQGADVEAVANRLADSPQMLYLIPSVHNPTGTVMPARERRRLAEVLADHADVVTIIDDTLAETYRIRRPPPPVASYPGAAHVLHTGSLSKLFWGGLRVGWVRGPVSEVRRLARLKALADLGTSIPAQLLALRVLREGEEFADDRRRMLAERGEALEAALAEALPQWTFSRPEGGLCLWVRLPHGSAKELAIAAARRGLALVPGSIQSPAGRFGDHLRLPYSHPPERLLTAVDSLREVWLADDAHVDLAGDLDDLRVVV